MTGPTGEGVRKVKEKKNRDGDEGRIIAVEVILLDEGTRRVGEEEI